MTTLTTSVIANLPEDYLERESEHHADVARVPRGGGARRVTGTRRDGRRLDGRTDSNLVQSDQVTWKVLAWYGF